jgi:hypothetical protein
MYAAFMQSQLFVHWHGALRHRLGPRENLSAQNRCGFEPKLGYNFRRLFNPW